jgi:pyruvate ferredoxin oxidoreductase gamma subunit
MGKSFTEIRWHGRAQQGTVTAARILAEAALVGGKHIQAFPDYGPERMGAPLRAYNRISDDPISIRESVRNPNIVAVVDSTLLSVVDIMEGVPPEGVIVINTPLDPDDVIEQLKGVSDQEVWTVDATKISLEEMGRAMPNTPMLGALSRASGIVDIELIKSQMQESFADKFPQKVIDANLAALERGYKEVKHS